MNKHIRYFYIFKNNSSIHNINKFNFLSFNISKLNNVHYEVLNIGPF